MTRPARPTSSSTTPMTWMFTPLGLLLTPNVSIAPTAITNRLTANLITRLDTRPRPRLIVREAPGQPSPRSTPSRRSRAWRRAMRGIAEHGFVQQDFEGALPDWTSWVEVRKQGGSVVHAVVDRAEALTWLANQDCITPHMWLSQRGRLDRPDRMIFDLDPSGSADFVAVRAS